jgi:hypothetical protein
MRGPNRQLVVKCIDCRIEIRVACLQTTFEFGTNRRNDYWRLQDGSEE